MRTFLLLLITGIWIRVNYFLNLPYPSYEFWVVQALFTIILLLTLKVISLSKQLKNMSSDIIPDKRQYVVHSNVEQQQNEAEKETEERRNWKPSRSKVFFTTPMNEIKQNSKTTK